MMKKHIWLIVILMMASAAAGTVASSSLSFISRAESQRKTNAAKPAAHKYEYQFYVGAGPKDLTDQTNKLADDGWELTEVITDERVVTRYIGFFKRPKP